VYLTGGEPTIMAEVLEFMRQCIANNRTDFELTFGTNGVKLSDTFLKLCSNFSKLNFSFSLDGYDKINDYWRWGSDWKNIVKNMHTVKNQGHIISVNTVPGIYNVTNLHLLFEWLDIEFPETSIYLQFNYFKPQSAFNHPNHDMVMESMRRCMNTQVYLADGKSTKTGIDSIFNHYNNQPNCDVESLREFFNFNDKLDLVRNTKLIEYIPELEACRHLLQS
jgi:molybdenum cofactor biosynthesis enzyme MoaA